MTVTRLPIRAVPNKLKLWHNNGGFTVWSYDVRNHPMEMIAHPQYFAPMARELSEDDFIFVSTHWENRRWTQSFAVVSVEQGKVVLAPNASPFEHTPEPIYDIEKGDHGKFNVVNRSGVVVRQNITKTLAEQLISKNIRLEDDAA